MADAKARGFGEDVMFFNRIAAAWAVLTGDSAEQYQDAPQHVDSDGCIHIEQYEVERWQVRMRRVLAHAAPSLGYGACACCHLPWWVVQGHDIEYGPGSGCFPVCELHRNVLAGKSVRAVPPEVRYSAERMTND
jgi:hypothetical protein